MKPQHVMMFLIGLQVAIMVWLLVPTLMLLAKRWARRDTMMREACSRLVPVALTGDQKAVDDVRAGLVSDDGVNALHMCVDEWVLNGQGRSVLPMRRLCRSVGLTERLQEQAQGSPDALQRAVAARTLLRLREDVSLDDISTLLVSEDQSVVLAAAEAMALSGEPKRFVRVLRALCERTPAGLSEMTHLLRHFGEDVCPGAHGLLKGVLRQHIDAEESGDYPLDAEVEVDRHETAVLVAIVDLLASHRYSPAVPTFSRLLAVSTDPWLRQRLACALTATTDTPGPPARSEVLAA